MASRSQSTLIRDSNLFDIERFKTKKTKKTTEAKKAEENQMLSLPKLAFLLTVLATVHLSGCDQPGSEPTGVEQTGVEQTDAGVTSADQTDADVLETEKTKTEQASAADESVVTEQTQKVSTEEVKQELQEAAEATKQLAAQNLAAQNKEEYVQKLDQQLKQIDRQIENLSAKGEGLTEDAMRGWQGTLVDLKSLRQQYQFKYDRLTESGGDAWQDMRDGIEQASNELQKAIEKAAERFEQSSSPNETE